MTINQFAGFVIYLLSLLTMLGLMLFLLFKARRAASSFIWLLAALLAWLLPQFVAQYATGLSHRSKLWLVNWSLLFAGLVGLALYRFVKDKTRRVSNPVYLLISLTAPLWGFICAFLPFADLHTQINVDNLLVSSPRPFYNLLVYNVLVCFLVAVIVFGSSKNRDVNLIDPRGLVTLRVAIMVALAVNGLCVIFLPNSNWSLVLNAASLMVMTSMMYYALFKHVLFDVKLLLSRALVYVCSIATVLTIYELISYFTFNVAFRYTPLSIETTKIVYAIMVVYAILIFPPLKRRFQSIASKLFFKHSYDLQTFIDAFNKVVVSNFELTSLLSKSVRLIEDTLGSQYCLFVVHQTSDPSKPLKFVGTKGAPQLSKVDVAYLDQQVPRLHLKAATTASITDKHLQLRQKLSLLNVAVVARLATNSYSQGNVGYMLLGPKKNGSHYSPLDMRIINILASELVIAVQNALHTEEIQNFNATLQERIVGATRKLRNNNEKLQALDEAKDDFVSMASHQLRTPLTSIKGYTSMVLEGDAGEINDLQRKLLEQSYASSQRMVFLIADLLNISRLKTGKFLIDRKPVDLSALVQQEVKTLQTTANERSLSLQFESPPTFPILQLDETKTRQVIMNFIDNAVYYTLAGGQITVQLLELPTSIEFRVTDTGIGVPKSERPHLFTKFYRAENARRARPDGTGLGLFMAKKVIVAQGGAIIFETVEGKGSTFGFMFPKSAALLPKGADSSVPSLAAKAVKEVAKV